MNPYEILRTANHNLFRNKVRTLLTIIAIFVGSFTIILNSAIHSGVNAFIDEQTASLGGEDFIMLIPANMQESMSSMVANSGPIEFNEEKTPLAESAFTDEDLEKLKNVDGLNGDDFFTPSPISGTGYYASDKTDKRYTLSSATILPPGNFKIPLSAGTLPDDSSDEYQITLEPEYAQALGYDKDEDIIGQTITISFQDQFTKEFHEFPVKVVGVEAAGIVSMSSGSVISHSLYEALYDIVTQYYPEDYEAPTYYIMATYDTSRFTEDEIKQKIQDAGYYAWTVSDMMGQIRTFFDTIMIVFTIFGAIALLAAAIGIINTLLMSVEERTREIGLDKALGMSSGRVFTNFSVEAILLGFWGSAFGVAVAMLVGYSVNNLVHAPGGFLEVFPTFQLFKFTVGNILPIILVVMLIAFIAGTAPAWKAAHKNPIDALRYE